MTFPATNVGVLVDNGVAAIQTGPFGTQLKASDYVERGIPVINVRNIGYGSLRPEKLEFVSDATAERLGVHVLIADDIVFGRKGAVDRHVLVGAEQAGWMQGSDCIRLRFTNDSLNPRYVSYAFLRSYHKEWMLLQCGNKATMASLNQDVIRRIELPLPGRQQQDAIVSILSTYDDLIDNNRKRIALLEEAARLLYREWFVHLRFPGHEHVKVVDGVPEGWERRPLSACAAFQSGGTPSKARAHFWQGDVPWISSGELTSMRISTSTQLVTDEAVQAGSRYAGIGTILGVVRGMSLAKEFRLGVVSKRVCFNQDLKAFVPDRGIESLYLFHSLDTQRDRIRQSAGEASHGTKKLETAVLEAVEIPVAPPTLRQHFVEYAAPLHRQMDVLTEQTTKLERARDLLLPRLMSGVIAV